MSKCCICGCPLSEFGNNPWPVSDNENDRCCDACNVKVVIPKRIELSFKNKEEEKENV